MLTGMLHGTIWVLCWGERPGVCEAAAAGVPLTCDWFLLGVLHCAVVRVYIGIGCFGTGGCRSQCSGRAIVVILCCHVRRCMQVCHVMLQNAL